jgi:hypothetical protein
MLPYLLCTLWAMCPSAGAGAGAGASASDTVVILLVLNSLVLQCYCRMLN